MASAFKINNVYHYQCIIKYKYDDKLVDVLTKIDEIYKINNKVDVSIDVDPIRVWFCETRNIWYGPYG